MFESTDHALYFIKYSKNCLGLERNDYLLFL